VLFEVARYATGLARDDSDEKKSRYVAFVLSAGQADAVRIVDLGDAEEIDRMVEDFRMRAGTEQAQRVRMRVLDQAARVAGCRELVIARDAGLLRLPFEELPGTRTDRIADDFKISYTRSGRDLVSVA